MARKTFSDPTRLRQILMNLIGNAIKFTESGQVQLSISYDKGRGENFPLEIAVSDTGIGIEESHAAELFKPFSQADDSTTRKFGGTGLGLSICKRLVELMNGTIPC